MIACTCGYHAETEGDLMSHVLENHQLSFGLESCCPRELSVNAPEVSVDRLGAVDFLPHI